MVTTGIPGEADMEVPAQGGRARKNWSSDERFKTHHNRTPENQAELSLKLVSYFSEIFVDRARTLESLVANW